MSDLEVAKARLVEHGFSVVIVKNGALLYSDANARLLPLVKGLLLLGDAAAGSSVADKVLGRAAAMFLVQAKVGEVFSPLMSAGALSIFEGAGIRASYENLVPQILNQSKEKPCPMEQMVAGTEHAEQGCAIICDFFRSKDLI